MGENNYMIPTIPTINTNFKFTPTYGTYSGLYNNVGSNSFNAGNTIPSNISGPYAGTWNANNGFWSNLGQSFSNMGNNFINGIKNFGTGIKNEISDNTEGLINWMNDKSLSEMNITRDANGRITNVKSTPSMLGTGMQALQTLAGLYNGYLGYKNYKLAKDQFNFSKDSFIRNFNNQVKALNNNMTVQKNIAHGLAGDTLTVEDRARNSAAVEAHKYKEY